MSKSSSLTRVMLVWAFIWLGAAFFDLLVRRSKSWSAVDAVLSLVHMFFYLRWTLQDQSREAK